MFQIIYTESEARPGTLNCDFAGIPVDEYALTFQKFTERYSIKRLLEDDKIYRKQLKPRKQRICRFCKTAYNENEKFKPTAHLIAKAIGNSNLFSDFEC